MGALVIPLDHRSADAQAASFRTLKTRDLFIHLGLMFLESRCQLLRLRGLAIFGNATPSQKGEACLP